MQTWCPFAVRQPVPKYEKGFGGFLGGNPKICHHTTEGSSYVGAYQTYKKTGALPHFTDSYEGGVYNAWQHLPINVAASALRHPAHSGHTNRDNCIQIEHVGAAMFADKFLPGYLAGMGRLCRWIEAETGCPATSTVTFTNSGAHRLTWDAWHVYSGHLGHQHVPFNDHWDPGRLNIAAVLGSALPPTVPPITVTPFPGDHMHRVDINIPNLDDKGNGWVAVPNTAADKVVSVVAQGAFPPENGYWNLPTFGRQQRGTDTIIQISEADPKAPALISVWIAD